MKAAYRARPAAVWLPDPAPAQDQGCFTCACCGPWQGVLLAAHDGAHVGETALVVSAKARLVAPADFAPFKKVVHHSALGLGDGRAPLDKRAAWHRARALQATPDSERCSTDTSGVVKKGCSVRLGPILPPPTSGTARASGPRAQG